MRTFFVMFAITLLVGCGGAETPPLGQVQGVVTNSDGPVAGARVVFHPEEGRPSSGKTDKKGHYTLAYTPDVMGAKTGSGTIRVTVTGKAPAAPTDTPEQPVAPTKTFEMPSPFTVESGENTIDIDLSKAKPIPG